MKKYLLIFVLIFVSSCSKNTVELEENIGDVNTSTGINDDVEQNTSSTGIIEDTINRVEGYGDTLKGSIDSARDIQNMINDRYKDL